MNSGRRSLRTTGPSRCVLVLVLALAWPATALAGSSVFFVDANAGGAGTGDSWTDAFTDLQSALDDAQSGDQVWIAAGLYRPSIETSPGNTRSATFAIADGIALYGGFAGGETSLSQRDPIANPTFLSGDIGAAGPTGDNTYHVVTMLNTTAGAVLDGLNVIDGRANGVASEDQRGAGLTLTDGEVTLTNCRFAEHLSPGIGAALYAGGASTVVTLQSCTFEDSDSAIRMAGGELNLSDSIVLNHDSANAVYLSGTLATIANTNFHGNAGGTGTLRIFSGSTVTLSGCSFTDNPAGGVTVLSAGDLLIEDCLFQDNVSTSAGALSISQTTSTVTVRRSDFLNNSVPFSGAAMWVNATRISISECRFEGNISGGAGGALGFAVETLFGGAGGSPVTNCVFVGNTAASGGAIAATGGQAGFDVFGSNPVFTNCLISGNRATNGAALYVSANSEPQLINCTLSNNVANSDGGGLYTIQAGSFPAPGIPNVILRNSILWGNSDASGTTQAAQLFRVNGSFDLEHCDVQDWNGGLGGTGNFSSDPLFLDADGADDVFGTLDDDLRLANGSPAIDAGDAAALPTDESDLDCDGDTAEALGLDVGLVPRVDDNVSTPDTGVGPAPVIDLGAWESSAWAHLGNALAGTTGTPCLTGFGTLVAGTPVDHSLTNALPGATALLFIGLTRIDAPFKQGVLVPFPTLMITLLTDPSGSISLPAIWPNGAPSGFSIYMQYWIVDPAGPAGFSASNAVQGTTP
jgi:hypothetical protein